jgi:hypothetical protein
MERAIQLGGVAISPQYVVACSTEQGIRPAAALEIVVPFLAVEIVIAMSNAGKVRNVAITEQTVRSRAAVQRVGNRSAPARFKR